ncbi:hypothetical protein B0T09DRAFT_393299 [Sordaria sp. MPI-SDFR-AT-0083]|nr:hypothetical protein B0T09DRAFT_393299 [Sordaria sp. MPI-SDFR-AT-0083]
MSALAPAQEDYNQAKERLRLALLFAIAEDITSVAPNLLDRRALSDAYWNTKREVFRRHFEEEGLGCPGALLHGTVSWETALLILSTSMRRSSLKAFLYQRRLTATLMWNWYCKESKAARLVCPTEPLKAECEALLSEPDEGWAAYLQERAKEEETREAQLAQIRASRPQIKQEDEDEEMPLVVIANLAPNQAPAEPVNVAAAENIKPAADFVEPRDNQGAPKPLSYQDLLGFKYSENGLSLQWLFVPTFQPGYRYHVLVGGTMVQGESNKSSEHEAREEVAFKALKRAELWVSAGNGQNARALQPLDYTNRPELVRACMEGFELGSRMALQDRQE